LLAIVACARIVGNQWITFYSLYLCIYSLWTFVFSLIGVSWVMPKQVVNLLACWKGGVGWHWAAVIWGLVVYHVDYLERTESSNFWGGGTYHRWVETVLLLSLFDWMTAMSGLLILRIVFFCIIIWLSLVHCLCARWAACTIFISF